MLKRNSSSFGYRIYISCGPEKQGVVQVLSGNLADGFDNASYEKLKDFVFRSVENRMLNPADSTIIDHLEKYSIIDYWPLLSEYTQLRLS